jgi:hypothetical protein
VVLRLRDGVGPDVLWAATLDHLATRSTDLLAAFASVAGDHRAAIAAGGWTRMRSVRTVKARTIPRLGFCQIEQPGARGAALFAACAAEPGATVADVARRFADSMSNPPTTTAPSPVQDCPTGLDSNEEPHG